MEYGLISACLIGVPCRYDGRSKCNETVQTFIKTKSEVCWVPICPEQLGGLSTPRHQSEISNGRVIDIAGGDVTAAFERGAEVVVALAGFYDAKIAILKEGSPSCGSARIYDGSFGKISIQGEGFTSKALRSAGLTVYSEEDVYKTDICKKD